MRNNRGARLLLLASMLAGAGWTPSAAAQTVFRGTVRYEKVLPGKKGLNLSAPVQRPAAGIRVQILTSPGRGVLGSAFTDSTGAYTIRVDPPVEGAVIVRALAQTENTRVLRARDRVEWSAASAPFTPGPARTVTRDVLATDSGRVAGPFNIAMVIGRANALLRAADPSITLPRLQIRWDTVHTEGTYFNDRDGVAYVSGLRGSDSDEYDDHVIAHEYGHFLMASFSRDDSPAGEHASGDQLDPRLAWSEGWANFFAAVVAGNPAYVDTGSADGRQTVLLEMDMEQDVEPGDHPGIWSEHAVSSALWDWYDDRPDGADSLALGFAPLWTALTALRGEPDPYLLRFANALASATGRRAAIAASLGARGITYSPGESPSAPEPFPLALASGASVRGEVNSRRTRRSNLFESSAHYGFTLDEPRDVTLVLKITDSRDPAHADLDLLVFDAKGEPVATSVAVNGVGGSERISERLPAGRYRVEVRSWSNAEESRLSTRRANQGSYSLTAKY
jgi:hypothetical protein